MENKTLRIARWQIFRILRRLSILIVEFFTPTEMKELIEGVRKEELTDYPIDLCSPKLVSPRTLKKLMTRYLDCSIARYLRS